MRQKIAGITCGAVLAVAFAVAWTGTAFGTVFNQASQFTFLRAVELPEGRVLHAGTYWFVLADPAHDANLVHVFDRDRVKVVATIETNPTARAETTAESAVTLTQRSNNEPDVLLSWYYMGSVSGHRLRYSPQMEAALSEEPRTTIEGNETPKFYDGYAGFNGEVSLQGADDVMEAALNAPNGIPRSVLNRARCVVVAAYVPNTALVEGEAQTSAVMVCRTGQEMLGAWGAPIMYVLAGGSVGWQTAGPYSDYVLLVMDTRAMETLLHKDVRLGADLAVAAGPSGRGAYPPNEDADVHSQVLSYLRTGNAFEGFSLKGSTLRPDNGGNRDFYGPNMTAAEIAGETAAESPLAGQPLLALLDRSSPPRAS